MTHFCVWLQICLKCFVNQNLYKRFFLDEDFTVPRPGVLQLGWGATSLRWTLGGMPCHGHHPWLGIRCAYVYIIIYTYMYYLHSSLSQLHWRSLVGMKKRSTPAALGNPEVPTCTGAAFNVRGCSELVTSTWKLSWQTEDKKTALSNCRAFFHHAQYHVKTCRDSHFVREIRWTTWYIAFRATLTSGLFFFWNIAGLHISMEEILHHPGWLRS